MDEGSAEDGQIDMTVEKCLQSSIPFFETIHIQRRKIQPYMQEPDALWTAAIAPTVATTTRHTFPMGSGLDDFLSPVDVFHSLLGETIADFSFQAVDDTFFDSWISGEVDIDHTALDILL